MSTLDIVAVIDADAYFALLSGSSKLARAAAKPWKLHTISTDHRQIKWATYESKCLLAFLLAKGFLAMISTIFSYCAISIRTRDREEYNSRPYLVLWFVVADKHAERDIQAFCVAGG